MTTTDNSGDNGGLMMYANLWKQLVGDPLPEAQKFVYWATEFSDDTIRYGIQKTAAKNLHLNGAMTLLYRERYATSVMRGTMARRQQVQR